MLWRSCPIFTELFGSRQTNETTGSISSDSSNCIFRKPGRGLCVTSRNQGEKERIKDRERERKSENDREAERRERDHILVPPPNAYSTLELG